MSIRRCVGQVNIEGTIAGKWISNLQRKQQFASAMTGTLSITASG